MPEYRIMVVDERTGEILAEKIHAVLWEMSETEIKCRIYRCKKWAQHRWIGRANWIKIKVFKL